MVKLILTNHLFMFNHFLLHCLKVITVKHIFIHSKNRFRVLLLFGRIILLMKVRGFAGAENPCTLLVRNPHWLTPSDQAWGIDIGLLYNSRFSELLVHKPGENFLLSVIATLLSPMVRKDSLSLSLSLSLS